MRVVKIIVGAGAERFLSYAQRQLEKLLRQDPTGTKFWRKLVDDYYIEVTSNINPLVPGQHKIRVVLMQPLTYEFFTTEGVTWLAAPGNNDGSVTSAVNGFPSPVSTGVAAFSTDTFLAAHPPLRKMQTLVPGTWQDPNSKLRWTYNKQRNHQHVQYLGTKGEYGFSTSTRVGTTHQHDFWFDQWVHQDSVSPLTDYGVDLPLVYYDPGNLPQIKWPRLIDTGTGWNAVSDGNYWPIRVPGHGAMQIVPDDTYGTERYFIWTDSHNDFYVTPMSTVTGDTTQDLSPTQKVTLTDNYIKITPPFPSWAQNSSSSTQFAELGYPVYTTSSTFYWSDPSANPKLYDRSRYKWNFNSSGTKVCAVVCTNEVNATSNFNQHFTGFKCSTSPAYDSSGTALLSGAYTGKPYGPNKIMWPGVVEFEIKITRTGALPSQFTATMALATSLDPAATGKCFMAADYAYDDKRLKDLGVSGDDLVLAEYEVMGTYNPASLLYMGQVQSVYDLWTFMHLGTLTNTRMLSICCGHDMWRNFYTSGYAVQTSSTDTTSLGTVYESRTQSNGDWRTYGSAGSYATGQLQPFFGGGVQALDLRSFSTIAVYDYLSYNGTTASGSPDWHGGTATYSFGKLVDSNIGSLDPRAVFALRDYAWNWVNPYFANPLSGASRATLPMDETTVRWWRGAIGSSESNWGLYSYGDIFSHPKGSIAFMRREDYTLVAFGSYWNGVGHTGNVDRVEFFDGSKAKVTTHRELFNKAYGQTRDYSYYSMTDAGLTGVFASIGVWYGTNIRYTENQAT